MIRKNAFNSFISKIFSLILFDGYSLTSISVMGNSLTADYSGIFHRGSH